MQPFNPTTWGGAIANQLYWNKGDVDLRVGAMIYANEIKGIKKYPYSAENAQLNSKWESGGGVYGAIQRNTAELSLDAKFGRVARTHEINWQWGIKIAQALKLRTQQGQNND